MKEEGSGLILEQLQSLDMGLWFLHFPGQTYAGEPSVSFQVFELGLR